MMTTGVDHCRELAENIQHIFAVGFQADAATADFINSTFDYPDHQKLQAVLNDAGNCERDGLINLIVFPDSTVCSRMEALLALITFSEQDLREVISLLPQNMPTSVRMAGLAEAVFFPVPDSCVERFVSQLNVTRKIDPDIRAAIESCLPEPSDRLAALAGIRHSRVVMTEKRKIFLLQFIRQSGQVENDRWFFLLNFILACLGRQKTDQDVFAVFEAEKKHCLIQVENHRRLTEKLAVSNMETLLSQGYRIGLSGDISALLQQIQTIDEISRLVWDRIPAVQAPGLQNPEAVSFLFEKGPSR